jgi:hypothetical protein
MSKGSRPRVTHKFKENFDRIKWSGKPWTPPKKAARKKVHHIMPDIEPYRAVAGEDAKKGVYITSRSKEREYLKRNDCIQVGNEKDHFFKYNGKTHDNPTKDW